MAVEWEGIVNIILYASPLIISAIIGWIAGQATLKKALEATLRTFDEFTDVVAEAKDARATVAKALEDNAVSEEEYKQIFAAYEDLMKEVDEFTVSVKGMIDAYRELFGVVLSVFRDKFGK